MLTLFDISLAIARLVASDRMTNGAATAGTTTSLTDTVNLTQPNAYYDKGILWMRSGNHVGKVLAVTSHISNKLSFATPGTAIVAGELYSVVQNVYPYEQIKAAIMDALWETHIESTDTTLEGDGETLEFTIPSGVWDIKKVFFTDPDDTTRKPISTHWKEVYVGSTRKLKFDYGYAPIDGYTINLVYRDQHADLTTYSSEINSDIDTMWLQYKAAENLLMWAVGKYGNQAEYRIEERLNRVLEKLKRLSPRRGGPNVIIHTAGG
jgi:hypothetical protein